MRKRQIKYEIIQGTDGYIANYLETHQIQPNQIISISPMTYMVGWNNVINAFYHLNDYQRYADPCFMPEIETGVTYMLAYWWYPDGENTEDSNEGFTEFRIPSENDPEIKIDLEDDYIKNLVNHTDYIIPEQGQNND